MNTKKLIFFALSILLVLSILFFWLSNLPKNPIKKTSSLYPTVSANSKSSPLPERKQRGVLDPKPSIIYPTPPMVDMLKITQQLPYSSDNLTITYSPILEQIIATYQTDKAEEEFNQWIKQENLTKNKQDLIDQRVIVIKNKDELSYQKDAEKVFSFNRELGLILTPTVNIVNPTPNNNDYQKNQSPQLLADLFNLLFNFKSSNIISPETIQPTIDFNFPTETINQSLNNPSPTITPSSNTPLPTIGTPKENATRIIDDNVHLVVLVTAMKNLFNEIGTKVGVPPKIIEGIMQMESQGSLSYSDAKVINYSNPGVSIPGCGPNVCSATGPMQMTTDRDANGLPCPKCCWNGKCSCPNAWAGYGKAVNTYGNYTHTPNPCNLRDNVYAAALKLKTNSRATSSTSWTQQETYRAGRSYLGDCTVPFPRLGNRTYCEFLWWYYNRI
ncbi:hypothetical protein COZ39_01955 [Candidatus Roizmanbacteria bacterium CG_4_10_14_3_um_filter_33_21]|uniref:Transglycosylase SLT domain-containing protein n=1 Tax=Candidatus Roizmanbacteria bacterium CG_4_10_14_3_um_filter_33_21 TaxID=1974830 RepID=A0A2M7M0C4_9BACT|nr:MAG: hypothetical protein COZ39_01955 [Candidatus Roizmanbacteria bacterium CG_4_10_14_3_um_filter_33_21]